LLPRRAAIWALGTYALSLGLIAFWPVPVDRDASGFLATWLQDLHRGGVPRWFDYAVVEFSANVILFFPLGALVARILGPRYWWGGVATGFLLSVLIELAQFALLPARFASVADVAANTLGGLLGALLARALMARGNPVRKRRPARTL
jgi:hypothetical protein